MATSLRPFNSIGGFSVGDNQTTVIDSNGNLITSVVSVSGNVEANLLTSSTDITALGNITGNFILGNGAFLTGLPAGFANADVANFLASGDEYDINLDGEVSATGRVIADGGLQTTNRVTANDILLTGDAQPPGGYDNLVTFIDYQGIIRSAVSFQFNPGPADLLVYGNMNATGFNGDEISVTGNIIAGGDVTAFGNGAFENIQLDGNIEVAGDVLVDSSVSATGNVTTDGYFIGNGSQLTGLPAGYSDSNVQTYLGAYNSLDIAISGNVSVANGGYFSGDAWALSNIAGANITGEVANAAYATLANGASFASVAGQANAALVAYSVDAANVSGQVASAAFASEATQSDYANTAFVAWAVDGANVSGAVSEATHATNATTANVAYSVDAANVSGLSSFTVNESNVALVAYSVDYGNVVGAYSNSNVDSYLSAFNAVEINTTSDITTNGTFYGSGAGLTQIPGGNVWGSVSAADVAYSVDGGNVSGSVANATYAETAAVAYSVDAANIVGTVADATHAAQADNANIALVAWSVDAANIVGGANLTVEHANTANVAYSVDAANIVGNVTFAVNAGTADTANVAWSVEAANVANLTAAIDNELAVYTGNIAAGNIAATGAIHGHSLNITGDGLVIGNLQVNGNLTYTDITEAYSENPTFTLGTGANGAPLTSDDGLDRAIAFDYFDGADKHAALIWEHSSNTFQLASDVTFSNGIATINTLGDIHVGTIYGNINGDITTNSLSVSGDLTAGDDVFAGGDFRFTGSTAKVFVNPDTGDIVLRGDENYANPGIVSASGYFNSPNGTMCMTLNDGSGNVNFETNIYVNSHAFANSLEVLHDAIANNISANSDISAVGSVTAADFIGGTFNGASISVSGNVIADNLTGANVSVTGNVTASSVYSSYVHSDGGLAVGSGTNQMYTAVTEMFTNATTQATLLTVSNTRSNEIRIRAIDTVTNDEYIVTVLMSANGNYSIYGDIGTPLATFSTSSAGSINTLLGVPTTSNLILWSMLFTSF